MYEKKSGTNKIVVKIDEIKLDMKIYSIPYPSNTIKNILRDMFVMIPKSLTKAKRNGLSSSLSLEKAIELRASNDKMIAKYTTKFCCIPLPIKPEISFELIIVIRQNRTVVIKTEDKTVVYTVFLLSLVCLLEK